MERRFDNEGRARGAGILLGVTLGIAELGVVAPDLDGRLGVAAPVIVSRRFAVPGVCSPAADAGADAEVDAEVDAG